MAIATGQSITAEDARAVCEMLNYAYGYEPEVYLNLVVSVPAWGSSLQEIATHSIGFQAASGGGYSQRFRFYVWIDPDVVTINVGATCAFAAANTGRIRFTIGAANVVVNFTSLTVTEQTGSIATSSTGTGWKLVTIEVDHQTGASGNQVLDLRIEGARVTSSLPSPVSE